MLGAMLSVFPHLILSTAKSIIIISPLYRWGNWSTKNLPQLTHSTSVRGGISTCKPKVTRSSILYLPSSASTDVASALGQAWDSMVLREGKAAAIAKRGHERIQNSNRFFPELLLIWQFVHRPSVFKTSMAEQMLELWLPRPQLAAVLGTSRWLQVTAPAQVWQDLGPAGDM